MIVAVVGVVILIIALAGILYHEKTYAYPEETEKHTYRIEWNEYSNEITDKGYVDKNGWKNNYTIDTGEKIASIANIEFKLSWSDDFDFHGFIFPWNFTDKIDMSVSIGELSFSQSGSGYGTISIKATGETPQDMTIEAKNESEVWENIGNVNNKLNCDVTLNIQPRPRFFDKGNDFTLTIIYHYYKPTISMLS